MGGAWRGWHARAKLNFRPRHSLIVNWHRHVAGWLSGGSGDGGSCASRAQLAIPHRLAGVGRLPPMRWVGLGTLPRACHHCRPLPWSTLENSGLVGWVGCWVRASVGEAGGCGLLFDYPWLSYAIRMRVQVRARSHTHTHTHTHTHF